MLKSLKNLSLYFEPVSSKNTTFISLVEERLANDEAAVAFIRYANTGGARDLFVLYSKDEFHRVLKNLTAQTSLTIFFESSFSIRGKASASILQQASDLLDTDGNEDEGLYVIELQSEDISETERFAFLDSREAFQKWFQENTEMDVLIGTLNYWQSNNKDVITVYEPDEDGVLRLGAY